MSEKKISRRALQKKIDAYFEDESSVKSVAGLALYLDMDSSRLAGLAKPGSGFEDIVGKAKTRIEKEIVENGLRGKYNATMSSFLLKTLFGYNEKAGQSPTGAIRIEVAEELKKYEV